MHTGVVFFYATTVKDPRLGTSGRAGNVVGRDFMPDFWMVVKQEDTVLAMQEISQSTFLSHYVLCQSRQLPSPPILLSNTAIAAMIRAERSSLQSSSKEAACPWFCEHYGELTDKFLVLADEEKEGESYHVVASYLEVSATTSFASRVLDLLRSLFH